MKLPEYDNRPLPGEALYDNSPSRGDDFKWTGAIFGLVLFWGAFFVFLAMFLIELFS